jgi:hypothetical protein
MPSARYKAAVERAAAALAHSILDPSGDEASGDALVAALRVFVGNEAATAFPPEAVERVQRDVLVAFGDRFSGRLRRDIDRQVGADAAEAADHLVTDGIAELLRGLKP